MRFLTLLLIFIACSVATSSTFEELEEKLKGIRSVKVFFIQKTVYPWYPKPELSKGIFYATRDGKFRIEYTYPDRIIMVSNGKEIIIYNEEDKEAIIDSVKNNTSPVIESLFFFSRPLGEVFDPVGELRKGSLKVVILRPKRKDENIREVYVEVDAELNLKRIKVIDSEGTETIVEFVDMVKNYTPSSRLFKFDLPPDARVRRAGNL